MDATSIRRRGRGAQKSVVEGRRMTNTRLVVVESVRNVDIPSVTAPVERGRITPRTGSESDATTTDKSSFNPSTNNHTSSR